MVCHDANIVHKKVSSYHKHNICLSMNDSKLIPVTYICIPSFIPHHTTPKRHHEDTTLPNTTPDHTMHLPSTHTPSISYHATLYSHLSPHSFYSLHHTTSPIPEHIPHITSHHTLAPYTTTHHHIHSPSPYFLPPPRSPPFLSPSFLFLSLLHYFILPSRPNRL